MGFLHLDPHQADTDPHHRLHGKINSFNIPFSVGKVEIGTRSREERRFEPWKH